MFRTLYLLYATMVIGLSAQVALAAGEREAFNPPGWVGFLMAFLALALPIAVSFWIRRK